MKKRNHQVTVLFITAFFLMLSQSNAQNYLKEPESVVFDAARNRYLISNKGNGKIIQMVDGVQSIFSSDQASIRGLHILGDTLYAACNAGVVGYNLATNAKALTVSVSGKNFLNDITSDGTSMLYVTDNGAGKIFKVNPLAGTSSTFVSGLSSPNGIFHDQTNNRLLLCYFRSNSPISAISIANGSVSQVVSTTLDDLDGITEDSNRRIYVSSWGSNAVYRFDAAFSSPPEQVSSGHSGPADIFFNKITNTLAVPNMNSNTVDFIAITTPKLLNGPVSVVFDPMRNRYLISNKNDGKIIQMVDTVQTIFNSDLTTARGIHILGDRLYAACNEGVVGFSLETGAKSLTIPLPGMQFPHDITSDGLETLYISDTVEGIIYKVKPSSLSVSTFVSGLNMPQGLLYDDQNHRLLVCHYLNNSPINAISLTDSSVSLLVSTPFFNLDGLAQDNDGRIYVSCRGNNKIYRYDGNFHNPPEQISNGFDEPADIFINKQDNILAVPNLNNNTVDFIEIEPAVEPPVVTENTYTVINTQNSGSGSLRQAIRDAMQSIGPDSVVFNIPTSDANYNSATGVWTITLETFLELQPDSCTIIDGTTQAQNQGDTNPDGPEIELNGNNTADYAFWGASASNIIKGLVINRFTKSGIILISAMCTGNHIESNYIGTDADGLTALPNKVGIEITTGARYNIIGGMGRKNLISGNAQWGMALTSTYVTGNEILHNYIGTDITGLKALGNGSGGIAIGYGAYGNIIGPDNLISGSVNVTADLIGNGIFIQESNGNIVKGNYIGTGANWTTLLGNSGHGVAIIDSRKNIIGGTVSKDRNVIAGNGLAGILIQSSLSDSNLIMNNSIGVDMKGTLNLGNGMDGVLLNDGAHDNTIGWQNVIFYNGRDGVRVDGDLTLFNTITENSISRNKRMGINNVNGGNGEIHPPVITEVSLRVVGSTYPDCTVEIFSDEADEGRLIEGIRTSGSNGTFSLVKVVSGPNTTATVTDKLGNTSEFSDIFTDIEDVESTPIPNAFLLEQNYPNPFNPKTTISYQLPVESQVELTIFSITGQKISTLVSEQQRAGNHRFEWDGSDLASGVYIYQLQTEKFTAAQKLLLLK